MGPVRFTINADDFGYSTAVNAGIMAAFDDGLIHTATLMTNMPGFDEACELIHSHALKGRIGVHLNISEGRPLSSAMKGLRVFCGKDGFFSGYVDNTRLFLSRAEMKLLREELRHQTLACLLRGITPTHIDSHNHFHTIWPVASVVISVAEEFGIGEVRLSRNVGPRPGCVKWLYKRILNERLRLHSLARSRFFGSVEDFLCWQGNIDGVAEIMVHPELDEKGLVIDRVSRNELKADFRALKARLSQAPGSRFSGVI